MRYDLPEWANHVNCAITVCDIDWCIIYMNERARATFAKHGDLIGRNLAQCHNDNSKEIMRRMVETGESNCYTITKGGVHKMIYQTPWRDESGRVAGLVEISMVIPEEMPHYDRDAESQSSVNA